MNHIHLAVGLRFKLYEKIYMISKILSDGNIQAIDQVFNKTVIFTKKELIKQLDLGILNFEVHNRNSKNSICEANFKFDIDDIEFEKHKDEAIFKFNVIKPFIFKDNICRTRSAIIKRVEEVNSLENNKPLVQELFDSNFFCKVSVASIYRWINQYEDSNRDIRSLIPGYRNCGGKNKFRLSSVIIDFLQEEINDYYLSSERPTIRDLFDKIRERVADHNEFSDEKIKAPSYPSITHYIKSIPEYDLIAYRIGKRTAENKYGQVNGGVEVTYPLERVEIDGTPLDLIVTDEEGETIGRPTFILALDKLSRYPLGFSLSFGNESWQDVMLCIWHILKDKSYVNEKYPDIKNEWSAFGIPQIKK
ncbi:hypothetical protein [Clostridium sp. DJ247]|uniref:hypothetical protein n=1 Tax=Clostridium sp. DJ247 TaxID=2726188 RepID=UPI0016245116|nr:hypothetical protein [Clostridium sp. DJ247]MBC2580737.1 hypothetical protein [Clostridium sp. DJ247]